MVIATQNPVEHHGTYPLPESQLDRFLMRLRIGYPDAGQRARDRAPARSAHGEPIRRVLTARGTAAHCRTPCSAVTRGRSAGRLHARDRRATRTHEALALGVSPRGSQALYRAVQALALLEGREYAIPDDVKRLASRCSRTAW